MDPAFLDMAKGFGSSAPIIGILLYLFSSKSKEAEKRTDQLLELIPKAIEAENDMTRALETLAGKLGK